MTKSIQYILIMLLLIGTAHSATLTGRISNIQDNEPVQFASLLIVEMNKTVMSNKDGKFELQLAPGNYTIHCSHIAFYTFKSTIEISDDTTTFDISLHPSLIELPDIKVYERNYDAAQEIIIEAIRNKDKILAKLNSYSFDAYTKLSIWDANKPDSLRPLIITETELSSFWKYPETYKEIINARKQSSNLDADENLVTVGKVLNFNNNRIDFGVNKLVSPTAKDALDYYNYYLLDTLYYDSLAVYLLEIEPKSSTTPLFIGTLQINSQSYEVMGVEVHINEGLDNPYLKKLELSQKYQLFDNKYWMPTVIKFDGEMNIPFPLIPSITFSYTAGLQKYKFEETYGDTIFNEYVLEVDKNADKFDSTAWIENRFIPLSVTDELAYSHIDSVEQNRPLYKKILPIIPASLYLFTSSKDFFHFNRVEGPYLGAKIETELVRDKLNTKIKSGYAFELDYWQYEIGMSYKLTRKNNITLGGLYRSYVRTLNTLNSDPNGNATAVSLFGRLDQYDYYKEKGFSIFTSMSPVKNITFKTTFSSFKQYSLYKNTEYAFFNTDHGYRQNIPITDGKNNTLDFDLTYNSNKKIKVKGKEQEIASYPYTKISIGYEISDTSSLKSDFEYQKLNAQFITIRQILGIGLSSLKINYTTKLSGELPVQKYSVVDFGGMILEERMHFLTMNRTNFLGDQIYSFYYNHNFGTRLFKKSKLPLIKDIPYSLSIHGGVFWRRFKDADYQFIDSYSIQTGDNPYKELGFTIGRLPLMLALGFTWQLSDYDTYDFSFGFGFEF